MGQIAYLAKQGGDAVFNTVFVGRLIAQAGTTLRGNLVVSGSITAQTLIVDSTSVYSGSTRFGNIITNTHQFTGSISTSGSITIAAGQYNGSGAGLTSIPNSALNNSTISGIALGSNLATLTIGTGLSGTSYNGSGAVTIANTITNTNQLTNGAGYITSTGTAAAISTTISAPNEANLIYAQIADNDFFRIRVGGSSNAGFVEIATADDGTEPIYVRQYTGTFSSLTRTATLLDGSGNTSFPGTVSATFSGNITGNVTGNCSGTSNNITAHTINQSVGTGNSPSFVAVSLSGNLTVSTGNATGGGIILADDGDIVDLNDGFCAMRFSSGVRIHSGNRGGGAVIRLGSGGDIVASSDITAYGSPSDITLKENIKPIETALDKILKLQGVTFEWKKGTDTRDMTHIKEDIGFIAQQVQEIVPELVRKNDNGLLSLRDKGITALLVEAIKEQQAQIEELKAKLG